MAIVKGTDKNDVLRATSADDIVYGLLGDDTLLGYGGADQIEGGDGNDVIHGDGIFTVADHLRETGSAVFAAPAGSTIVFTSMGLTTLNSGTQASVWRVRNQTSTDQIVVITVPGTAISFEVFAKAQSDTLFTSPSLNGTHVMKSSLGSSTKAAGTQTFSYDAPYGASTEGNDTLDGGKGRDTILGHGGNDILTGGADADVLDGGSGKDRADYRFSAEGVSVNLLTGMGSGGEAEGDILRSIENLSGSSAADWLGGDDKVNRLVGRQGNDSLFGAGGNDVLLGGSGADHLDGGTGVDTADYTGSWSGVIVDLLKGTGQGAEAKGDTLTSIENVVGSAYGDEIRGDDNINRLNGGNGDDVLVGNGGNDILVGGAGADKFDGGEGTRDVADYGSAAEGVGVDLVNGGFAGEAQGDSFTGIEYVYGSRHADKIIGNDDVNRLVGKAGDDYLAGQGGDDYLVGGAGGDVLEGGKGADVFVYDAAGFGADTIGDFEAGTGRTDRVWLTGQGVASFDEVMKLMTDSDGGAILKLENGSILFQGVLAANFTADDFMF